VTLRSTLDLPPPVGSGRGRTQHEITVRPPHVRSRPSALLTAASLALVGLQSV